METTLTQWYSSNDGHIYNDTLFDKKPVISDVDRVREWIASHGDETSSKANRQLLSQIVIKGKMSSHDLMKRLETSKMENLDSSSVKSMTMERKHGMGASEQANHSKRPRADDLNSNPMTNAMKRQKKHPGSTPWYNGTEYQCQICSCLFYKSSKLIEHINARHRVGDEKYRQEFGQLSTRQVNYKCQVCEQCINHEHEAIER